MVKNIKFFMAILFLCMLCDISEVSAQKNTEQQTDAQVITAHQTDFLPLPYQMEVAERWRESCDYIFTNKSAGKIIPLQIDTDGIMRYSFSSDKMELLDENKRVICGKTDDVLLGNAFPIRHDEETHVSSVFLLPVKRENKYYVRFPDTFTEGTYGMFAYVFPEHVKRIKSGKGKMVYKDGYAGDIAYLSKGNGKYIYYPFTVKKKSMAVIRLDLMFLDREDVAHFKVQKKVKGKWRNITSERKRYANYQHNGNFLYGFSKGKYRLGIKVKKGQIARISLHMRNVKYKNTTDKDKAPLIKKGKKKEGMFVWEDTKAHWYKVVKTSKNKVKKLEVQTGTAKDKTTFTIYKEGQKTPLKKMCFRGHDRAWFGYYRSKTYTLKDNGTYYIKVSKANKKTNGAYKIGVK